MKVKIDDLSKKNTNLQNSFSRFYMGQQKLDRMLETQSAFFDKDGLGYDDSLKETHMKHLALVHIVIDWVILDNFVP